MADPTLYLYTSLTAGSSHIITATSRMETILKANKQPFRAIDCATDEKARQLWSRRSKGRKLPGLVKFGQIIGDITEVEEWNEYGELVDQIESASDLFGDTPMTDTPMPPPVNTLPPNPLKPIIDVGMERPAPGRQTSEGRHISISEPAKSKKEDVNSAGGLKDSTPLAMAMKQAGAEAAAKAGQNKAAAAAAAKAKLTESEKPTAMSGIATTPEVAPRKKSDPSETTPTAAATKMSTDATLDLSSPEDKTNLTSAKTPAQLASEGVRRTSVDLSATQAPQSSLGQSAAVAAASDASSTTSGTADLQSKSTEEQVLEQRRTSSIAKTHSSLARETSVNDVSSSEDDSDDEDESESELSPEQKAAAQAVANVKKEQAEIASKKGSDKGQNVAVKSTDNLSNPTQSTSVGGTGPPKSHRGSSISLASDEEIKKIEAKNAIKEESEDDDDDDDEDDEDEDEDEDEEDDDSDDDEDDEDDEDDDEDESDEAEGAFDPKTKVATQTMAKPAVAATSKMEAKVVGGAKPQEQKAGDAKDADKSVGD